LDLGSGFPEGHGTEVQQGLPVLMALIIGLAAFAMTSAIRKLPLIRDLIFDAKKPWACNFCMSFWAALALHLWTVQQDPWVYKPIFFLSSWGLCLLLLQFDETRVPYA
jgi:hypothetical protein